MRHYFTVGIAAVLLVALACTGVSAQNLLKNPGFEDTAGWSTNWTIRDAKGGNLTYHYHLTSKGGGHGDATPRTGKNAVEIYSTDRQTYLAQKVNLEPGTYRLSGWVRSNGMPGYSSAEIRLGDQKTVMSVISQKYRLIWADFKIVNAGEYEASFFSSSYGMAVDDMSLEKVTENASKPPALYIEIYPSSTDKASGIQNCLKGSLQWVDLVTTCVDSSRIKRPVMRILASDPVKLSGLNEGLIHGYRMRNEDEVKVQTQSVVRDGKKYQEFSFLLPRFVSGYLVPQGFGGFWISNVPAKGGKLIMEVVDGDDMLASEVVKLVVIDPPKVSRTPKKYYTFSYCVQSWQQSLEERVQAIPAQFKMMGFNVWSDYGFHVGTSPKLANEELVMKEACEKYGVQNFWPNFSELLDANIGNPDGKITEKYKAKDMYVVGIDGKVNDHMYNFNYAANRGQAWVESMVEYWVRAIKRPIEQNLPFKTSGLVNDALEGVVYSYDPSTLAAFAAYKGVDASEVTKEKLWGEWKKDWLLFNMDLYTRVVDAWTEKAREVNPDVKMVNTASTYGPHFEGFTPKESMKWARSVDYNMPQWYTADYYGAAFADYIKEGEAAGVYGKANGGTDLIPLLNLSMGAELVDPLSQRFKILDFFSGSKSIKGVGYYIGSLAYTDAKCMVGLSKVHTLIADIEDFYADGVRDDSLVRVTEVSDDESLVPGMDLDGQQIMVKPKITNSVRVHKLGKDGRIALITVITYNEQGLGGRASLEINKKMLPNDGKDLVLINRLTGKKQPLPDKITVDTRKTNNVAVYEIAEK